MTSDCQNLIDSYTEWIRSGFRSEDAGAACKLTTPFLDRHNDFLQVYSEPIAGGRWRFTDDGYVLADLEMSGLEIDTEKRESLFNATINGFGVKSQEGELFVESDSVSAGKNLHALVQAMLAVNDLFVMAKTRVASFFYEDVREFLREQGIPFTERVKFAGRSGLDQEIDFVLPEWNTAPERLVKTINNPSKANVTSAIFTLTDAHAMRSESTRMFTFLNDTIDGAESSIGRSRHDAIEAMRAYNIIPVAWSSRTSALSELR